MNNFVFNKSFNILFVPIFSGLLGLCIAINNPIFLAVLLLPFLLTFTLSINYIYLLAIYIFTLPLDFIVVLEPIGSLSKILSFLSMISLLVHGLYKKKLLAPNKLFFPIMLMIIFSLFSLDWSVDKSETITRISTLIPLFLFYSLTSIFKFSEKDLSIINKSLILSLTLVIFISLIQYFLGIRFMETGRLTITLFDKQADPNHLFVSMVLPLGALIMFINSKDISQKNKNIGILLLLLFAVILILSGSRGALLSTTFVFLYWFIKDGLKLKKLLILLFLVALLVIVYYFLPSFLLERYSVNNVIEYGGTGRLDIWKVGFNAFLHSIYIGYGFGTFSDVYDIYVGKTYIDAFWGYSKAAHNTFLRMAVELGIIGLFLFLWIIVQHIKLRKIDYYKNDLVNQSRYIANMGIVGIIIGCLSLDVILFKYFWLTIQYSSIVYNLTNRKEEN
jgi:putative inorganic carbon (hco3(-)) transporter